MIEESCIGALHRKDRGNDRISKIVDRFRPERELKRKLTTQGITRNRHLSSEVVTLNCIVLRTCPFNGQGLGDKNLRRADDSLEASITGSLDSESSTGEFIPFFFFFIFRIATSSRKTRSLRLP